MEKISSLLIFYAIYNVVLCHFPLNPKFSVGTEERQISIGGRFFFSIYKFEKNINFIKSSIKTYR